MKNKGLKILSKIVNFKIPWYNFSWQIDHLHNLYNTTFELANIYN